MRRMSHPAREKKKATKPPNFSIAFLTRLGFARLAAIGEVEFDDLIATITVDKFRPIGVVFEVNRMEKSDWEEGIKPDCRLRLSAWRQLAVSIPCGVR